MSIRRVVPNIEADQLDASRAFYADFLGFNVGMDLGWIVTFVAPDNPTAQISVLLSGVSPIPHPQLSIEVRDVDAVYAEAQARGLAIVYALTDEPWGVRRFFVRDPNGTVINILSQ